MIYVWYFVCNKESNLFIAEHAFDEVQWKTPKQASDCDCSFAFWLGAEAEDM